MSHALLGPSSASRWMACPPSARLCESVEEKESDYAKEGSLAHEIGEIKLKRKLMPHVLSAQKFGALMKKLKEHGLYQEEMQGYTDEYVDFVMESYCGSETTPFIAIEQKVSFEEYVPGGFGTADCILIYGDTLHVIDFKYGKGVLVQAEENKQMLLYALGAYLEYNFLYEFKNIKMSIVQPRLNNIDSWECSIDYLLEFAELAKEKGALADIGDGEFNAGEHCKFCGIKISCRERAERNLELAKYEFKKPPEISNEELGEILKKAQDLVAWANDLKDYALAEVLKGNEVNGWKAVNGRTSRAFTDTDEAIKVLIDNGTKEEMLYERKYLTLAQMEKVIGKKEFNETLKEYIVVNPGKPTLALASDKRPAITNKISATDEFSVIDDVNKI